MIILTSTGLTSPNVNRVFNDLTKTIRKNIKIAIVVTAAKNKDNNKYSILAKNQFCQLGFWNVDFVDLELDPAFDFSPYKIIYVCGGNTYKLLKHAKLANMKTSILNLLKRKGIYIGVSAGAIILSPSIQETAKLCGDKNNIGLTDFSGLNIISFEVLPHYTKKEESKLKKYERTSKNKICRIKNGQAFITNGGRNIFIDRHLVFGGTGEE